MVLCEWCQLWDHSAFVLKQALDWRVEKRFEVGWGGGGGEALLYLAYTGQVCAAEHKVLGIKQGVEFYYFNSKILITWSKSLTLKDF